MASIKVISKKQDTSNVKPLLLTAKPTFRSRLRHQNTGKLIAASKEWVKGDKSFFVHIIAFCVMIAPAIGAIIIALYYEKAECDGNEYMIDLQLFLYIGGSIQLGICSFHLVWEIYALFSDHDPDLSRIFYCVNMVWKMLKLCCALFLLTWAIIAILMWIYQMSPDCKKQRIAKMILAWGIYPFALGVIILLCVGLLFYCSSLLKDIDMENNVVCYASP